MDTDVIGARYRIGGVVACTPESTTWLARDAWLDEQVLVVTPEPGCGARFSELAGALVDRASEHFVGVYDVGTRADDFVAFAQPAATLSDERAPYEEENVLVAGRALGDALDALHGRGLVHGDLHPGTVVVADSGATVLSPWPLAPRPTNWGGPGGFGSGAEEQHHPTPHDDVRALGAVLLGALAGPPVLSSEQVANVERELAHRAPNAVAIADRAMTPPARGGYEEVAELRENCAAALDGQRIVADPTDEADPVPIVAPRAARGKADPTERIEGRWAALVVAATGVAVLSGLGVSGAFGVGPDPTARPASTQASRCTSERSAPRCAGSGPSAAVPRPLSRGASVARPSDQATARLAANRGAGSSGGVSGGGGVASTGSSSVSDSSSGGPTSTTVPATSTTSSTTTSASTTTSTPTGASTTTSTTTAPTTTTSSSDTGLVQAGPDGQWSRSNGSGGSGSGGSHWSPGSGS